MMRATLCRTESAFFCLRGIGIFIICVGLCAFYNFYTLCNIPDEVRVRTRPSRISANSTTIDFFANSTASTLDSEIGAAKQSILLKAQFCMRIKMAVATFIKPEYTRAAV